MKSIQFPDEFSVSNGYVLFAIATWMKFKGSDVDQNLLQVTLDYRSPDFFGGANHVVRKRSDGTFTWQSHGMKLEPHFETLDQFIQYMPNSVMLNEKYTAHITDNGIEVGCQVIKFEEFLKLAQMVTEYRANMQ